MKSRRRVAHAGAARRGRCSAPDWVALLLGGAALLLATEARAVSADALRAVANESTVRLTTVGRTSAQPRPVTIWFVCDGERIYVQSGKDGKTDWYRNLLKTPGVTLQIGALTLHGQARPIDDAREIERVHALFAQKYLRARVMGWFGSQVGRGQVVRIDALEAAP
jgi:deazaflavin-dependent oxidoreductase (nitroreductase family)